MRWLHLELYFTCLIFQCKKNSTEIAMHLCCTSWMKSMDMRCFWLHLLCKAPSWKENKFILATWRSGSHVPSHTWIFTFIDQQIGSFTDVERNTATTERLWHCLCAQEGTVWSLPTSLPLPGTMRQKKTNKKARSPGMAVITDTGKLKEGNRACSVGRCQCPQGCTPSCFENHKYIFPMCHCAAWGEAQNCKTDWKKKHFFFLTTQLSAKWSRQKRKGFCLLCFCQSANTDFSGLQAVVMSQRRRTP